MASKQTVESPDNELIKRIEGSEYIKNPLVYAQMRGNLSLLQTNVYVAIVSALQDNIKKYYDRKTNGGRQMTLFDEDTNGVIKLSIPMSTLGIRSNYYKEIEEAIEKMQNVKYKIRRKVNGVWVYESHVLLPIIKVPETTSSQGYVRKKGMIELTMMTETAKFFFDMNTGYVTHLKNIVQLCKNSRTPRLYIYLSYLNSTKYKGVGEVPYSDLKEFLGVLEYADLQRTEIKKDSYKVYSYFTRDILEPVRKELDNLADTGQVEFSFTYEPIYLTGKKRGNPDQLRFSLRRGNPKTKIEQKKEEKEKRVNGKDATKEYINVLRGIYKEEPDAIAQWNKWYNGTIEIPSKEECVQIARKHDIDITS